MGYLPDDKEKLIEMLKERKLILMVENIEQMVEENRKGFEDLLLNIVKQTP